VVVSDVAGRSCVLGVFSAIENGLTVGEASSFLVEVGSTLEVKGSFVVASSGEVVSCFVEVSCFEVVVGEFTIVELVAGEFTIVEVGVVSVTAVGEDEAAIS